MAEEPEEITNIEEEIDTAAPSQEELQQYGDNAIRTLETRKTCADAPVCISVN